MNESIKRPCGGEPYHNSTTIKIVGKLMIRWDIK